MSSRVWFEICRSIYLFELLRLKFGVAFRNYLWKILKLNFLFGMEDVVPYRLYKTISHFD